jgi:TPR repeat protein
MNTPITPVAHSIAHFSNCGEALTKANALIASCDYSGAINLLTPFASFDDRNILFTLNFAHSRRHLAGDKKLSLTYLNKAADLGHLKAIKILARQKVVRRIASSGYIKNLRPLILETAKAFLPYELISTIDLDSYDITELTSSVIVTLEKSVSQVDDLAQTALAVILLHDLLASSEVKKKALILLETSAYKGRTESIRFLGRAYADGVLIPANPLKAFEIYKFGTSIDCAESRHRLAECYLKGVGVDVNVDKAVSLLTESTQSGHPFSPCVLGCLYIEGKVINQNVILGRDLLRLSAFRRSSVAAAKLAEFFKENPTYGTILFERQAYAKIAVELNDRSKTLEFAELNPCENLELLASLNHIKSVEPTLIF